MREWWWRFRCRWREQIWPRIRPEMPRFFDWRFWWFRFRMRGGFNRYIPELPTLGGTPWAWLASWREYWSQGGAWQFLLGMPAMLAALIYLIIILSLSANTSSIKAEFMEIADRSLARKDYDTARLAHTRLLRIGSLVDERQTLFGLALSLRGLNQNEEASSILKSLASPDKAGYPPAHLYLARMILSASVYSPAIFEIAQRHLQQALTSSPNDASINELLGLLYAQQGIPDLALKHLLLAEPTRKEAGLALAKLALQRGDETESQRWANSVIQYFQPIANSSRAGNFTARIPWAQALLILRKYPEAIEVLEAGFRQSGKENFSILMGSAYADWLKEVIQKNPNDWSTRFNLLQRGLENAPQNADLHRELIRLSHLDGDQGETVRKTIRSLLAQGKNKAGLHLALGLDAFRRNQPELAREHILLAAELAPNMPSVINFKAMILSSGPQPDLPQALALVQALLEKYPNEPNFRETRGQIYHRMQRYREAIADVEFAMERLSPTPALHNLLSEAYQKLGINDMAEEHRRLAQKLKESLPELIANPKAAQ